MHVRCVHIINNTHFLSKCTQSHACLILSHPVRYYLGYTMAGLRHLQTARLGSMFRWFGATGVAMVVTYRLLIDTYDNYRERRSDRWAADLGKQFN